MSVRVSPPVHTRFAQCETGMSAAVDVGALRRRPGDWTTGGVIFELWLNHTDDVMEVHLDSIEWSGSTGLLDSKHSVSSSGAVR